MKFAMPPQEPGNSTKKTAHGINVDPNLDTSYQRFAPIDTRGGKRAHRRNRYRAAA